MKEKNNSRRTFIKTSVTSSIGFPLIGTSLISCNSKKESKTEEITKRPERIPKLNILILGGTSFLGPHQIAYALSRGHAISTFTRGKTKPTVHADLFDQVDMLIGDREDNLKALENRRWDVVIDNSGHKVEWTKKTAELLRNKVGLYVYTSSTGVYYPYLNGDIREDKELVLETPEDAGGDMKMEYDYGVMKANSENIVKELFGDKRALIIRPTYMIGPADKTDRFIHWPLRLSRGGEVMVPGKPIDPVQYIDVRDVAEWMIRLIEKRKSGTYNAVGPLKSQNIMEFVNEAKMAFDIKSSFVNIDDYAFLIKQKVFYLVPWIMPDENNVASALVNNDLAIENGLTCRPLVNSIRDIYDWWYSPAFGKERREKFESNVNTVLAREQDIIQAWKNS